MVRNVIDKTYQPKAVEERWYDFWERSGFFRPADNTDRPRFCMVIPPPNVTGSLHMGHALNHTLHDILARWRRMQGYNTLWLPGTDHASIAVHYVLERELERQGLTRFDLGREEFLQRAWKWKQDCGGAITQQMRRLGVSCDWSRERFTMDEGLSRAVREAFVRLYEEGLIYRGEYIVNWCPRCRTAISDLEVVYETVQGKLYYISYPIKGSHKSVIVATTRPETMLGDTAVAVHPDDERYKPFHGATLILPVLKRQIPLIVDDFVDPSFGTGAVKVTPAHDHQDFRVGLRHNLARIEVIGPDGSMTEAAGKFSGLDRFKCRQKLVEQLHRSGQLVKVEDYTYNLGHCQRCHTVVEPRVSLQWFVRVGPLAQEAIRVVEEGRIRFVPENFMRVYFEWMRNIHDWCISRQLWWGHRIPVWYCRECQAEMAARHDLASCLKCGSAEIEQDPDILDTWFSSALWPFSTLGWPDETQDLKTFYPTDVLITGPDIIFFWVARMIMLGMHFMCDVPFRTVYIHGIVRDAQRQKMSKTKGNVIDPLQIIDRYGADAVRFTLARMAAPGTDIPFSTERMKGYSAFANKVWNAARFAIMSAGEDLEPATADQINELLEISRQELALYERWILSRLNQVIGKFNDYLEAFRFDEAAELVYQFFWHELCDWYIEMVKPALSGKEGEGRRYRALRILVHVIDSSLRLLHPFMPYITEEIWQKLPHQGPSIVTAEFPKTYDLRIDREAEERMRFLMELITSIRSARSEMELEPSRAIPAHFIVANPEQADIIRENCDHISSLARLKSIDFVDKFAEDKFALKGVVDSVQFALLVDEVIDFKAERERLSREIRKAQAELEALHRKLNNQDFLTRAPREVIEETRRRYHELFERLQKLEQNYERLS